MAPPDEVDRGGDARGSAPLVDDRQVGRPAVGDGLCDEAVVLRSLGDVLLSEILLVHDSQSRGHASRQPKPWT